MSLRQAARAQNVVGIVLGRQIRCICKGSCIDDRCGCRRAKQQCDVAIKATLVVRIINISIVYIRLDVCVE